MIDSYSKKCNKQKMINNKQSGEYSKRNSRCVEGVDYRPSLQTTAMTANKSATADILI